MMQRILCAAAVPAVFLVTGATSAAAPKREDNHLYGPAPEWEHYRSLAEAELRSRLIDPESGRITWTGGYYKGEFKMFFRGRTAGYVACGTINAKNRMGGYVGAVAFVTVIDYGRVLFAEMDEPSGVEINNRCLQAQNEGLIPPLPESAATTTSTTDPAPRAKIKAVTASGLVLRSMPEGAYIGGVAPGSAAEYAGLKPGMVVTAVNGIPLAGMGGAMVALINAAGPAATLTVVGGSTYKLGAKP